MPLVAAAVIWLIAGTALIVCRRRRAPERQLTYSYTLPQPKGLMGLGAGMARSFEAMTWGSSYTMWKARCDASLRASRRRRGITA